MPQLIKAEEINYRKIADILEGGGVIVYPTDTAYALGADSKSAAGIRKIYKIKKRDAGKTLPLIAASLSAVKGIALVTRVEAKQAKKYWPGALTLLLKARAGLSAAVVKNGFLAARVPDNKAARRIALTLGRPIISTSANRTGRGSCYNIAAVKKSLGKLWDKVDLVIDAGALPRVLPSTIIKLKNKKEFTVLRQGEIKIGAGTAEGASKRLRP